MRASNWGIHWIRGTDGSLTDRFGILNAKAVEIGIGAAFWAGLIFVVVHFAGQIAA
ncbi:MAG: hypothetical protein WDM89_13975 [Rhizomicrobium sp.]